MIRSVSSAGGKLVMAIMFFTPVPSRAGNAGAPIGQSVLMHWIESTQVYVEGVVNPRKSPYREVVLNGDAKVYISDRGRPFGETSVFGGNGRGFGRNGNGRHQQSPDDDDDSDSSTGVLPWHWSLSGNVLAGTQVLVHGARQAQIVFANEAGTWRCALRVIIGKSEGEIVRYGRRQKPVHVLSSAISEERCEVVTGNVFSAPD